jgi:hypothetical protein
MDRLGRDIEKGMFVDESRKVLSNRQRWRLECVCNHMVGIVPAPATDSLHANEVIENSNMSQSSSGRDSGWVPSESELHSKSRVM